MNFSKYFRSFLNIWEAYQIFLELLKYSESFSNISGAFLIFWELFIIRELFGSFWQIFWKSLKIINHFKRNFLILLKKIHHFYWKITCPSSCPRILRNWAIYSNKFLLHDPKYLWNIFEGISSIFYVFPYFLQAWTGEWSWWNI